MIVTQIRRFNFFEVLRDIRFVADGRCPAELRAPRDDGKQIDVIAQIGRRLRKDFLRKAVLIEFIRRRLVADKTAVKSIGVFVFDVRLQIVFHFFDGLFLGVYARFDERLCLREVVVERGNADQLLDSHLVRRFQTFLVIGFRSP